MTFSDIRRVLRAHRCAGPKRPVAAGATHMETDPRFSLPTSGRYSISVSAGRSGKRPNGLARPSAAAPPAGAHWLRPIRGAAGPRRRSFSQIEDFLDQYDVGPVLYSQEEARHEESFLAPVDLVGPSPVCLPPRGHARGALGSLARLTRRWDHPRCHDANCRQARSHGDRRGQPGDRRNPSSRREASFRRRSIFARRRTAPSMSSTRPPRKLEP